MNVLFSDYSASRTVVLNFSQGNERTDCFVADDVSRRHILQARKQGTN